MRNKNFFKQKTALTAAKTRIYKEYIEGYLPKLLMSKGICLIADLFCGPGTNGKENGSPLILLERLNYILSSPQLQKKQNKKVYVLFNDQDKENIENLKKEVSNFQYDKNVIEIFIKNEKYENLLPNLIKKPEKKEIPKFFFLYPFTYSNVKMKHLKALMSLSNSEVLLFIPIFHTYRFSNVKEYDKTHRTRIFIEEFTIKGMFNYENVHTFMASMREKLLNEINIPYIRDVLLDGGGSKNSLFLLTNHQKGMLLMNKIAFRNTDNGSSVIVKHKDQNFLFGSDEGSSFYDDFREKLKEFIRDREVSNYDIVDFTIKNCCLPKHAKQELKKLYDLKKIKVFDENDIELSNSQKWNIADELKKETIFKWQK